MEKIKQGIRRVEYLVKIPFHKNFSCNKGDQLIIVDGNIYNIGVVAIDGNDVFLINCDGELMSRKAKVISYTVNEGFAIVSYFVEISAPSLNKESGTFSFKGSKYSVIPALINAKTTKIRFVTKQNEKVIQSMFFEPSPISGTFDVVKLGKILNPSPNHEKEKTESKEEKEEKKEEKKEENKENSETIEESDALSQLLKNMKDAENR